jgi:hypothetical protein
MLLAALRRYACLPFRTSVLGDTRQCRSPFDGLVTARTAQRRPRRTLVVGAGRPFSSSSRTNHGGAATSGNATESRADLDWNLSSTLIVLWWFSRWVVPWMGRMIFGSRRAPIESRRGPVSVGVASRRAGIAPPDRGCPVQVERPTGRTTWTGQTRSGRLRCVTGCRSQWASQSSPGPGRVALAAGGFPRVQGREVLPAGGSCYRDQNAGAATGRRVVISGAMRKALDPLESPVSGMLAWSVSVLTCTERLMAGGQTRPERTTDGLMLMLAVRNLIRAADWSANEDAEAIAAQARREVVATFHDRLPNVVAARDVLEHFDEYGAGRGRAQLRAVRAGVPPTRYSFTVTSEGDDVAVLIGPHRFDVAEIRRACQELTITLLAIEEREFLGTLGARVLPES